MEATTEVRSPVATFLFDEEPWKEQAACKGKSHLFFLERGQSSKPAKAICATCTVGAECEDYRRRTKTEYGIWNGRTAKRYSADEASQSPVTVGQNPTDGDTMGLKSLSATQAKMYENCPAQWQAVYGSGSYPPDVDNDAAKLGQTLHAALESFVGDFMVGGCDRAAFGDFEVLQAYFLKEYENRFTGTSHYKPGVTMLANWHAATTLLDGRKVLHTEQKKRFRIPVRDSEIPVNFVLDRHDLRANGEHEVVDYKSSAVPVQPDQLGDDLQARIYALGVQLEYPEADGVWVTFDMLRYDSVSRWFTKDENRETYRYLRRLAERIVNDKTFAETLNPDCRFCIRRFNCATLNSHTKAGGPLSISDPDEAANRRRELANAETAIKNMREQLDAYLLRYAEENDILEWYTDETVVTIGASKRRVFDHDVVLGIVGPDLMARQGNVTLSTIDRWLEGDELTVEQRSQLRQAIDKKYGDPKVKTKAKK